MRGLVLKAGVLVVLGVAALLALALAFFALGRYSTASTVACTTCHVDEPGWVHADQPHEGVDCVACHGEAHGPFVSGYDASPEALQPRCSSCHRDRAEATEPADPGEHQLSFSHASHVGDYEAGCLDCHGQGLHRGGGSPRPTMESCGACHEDLWDLEGCTKCHGQGAVAPPTDSAPSPDACVGCHPGYDTRVTKRMGRTFRHMAHEAAGIGCDRCHLSRHGELIAPSGCHSCHHPQGGGSPYPCERCHRGERDLRQGLVRVGSGPDGAGRFEVRAEPEAMADMAECSDCHQDVAKGAPRTSSRVITRACVECHEDSTPSERAGLIAERRLGYEATLEEIRRLERIYRGDERRMGAVERLRSVLEADSSRGFHNPGLTSEIRDMAGDLEPGVVGGREKEQTGGGR